MLLSSFFQYKTAKDKLRRSTNMKNIQIGAALKTMRKNRGWTIHDVVVQLNDLYNIAVAEKTVYGWESDQAYPRTETLLLLCELYQSDTFTGNLLHIPADKSFPITADERHVIEMYRRHPELQSAVKRVLDVPVKKPSAN
jgi:transcriptional regulator with XRE-family HTH domain